MKMNLNKNKIEVLPGTLGQTCEDWSSDGSQILYLEQPTKSHSNLWISTPDGNNKREIKTRAMAFAARWSPDGKSLYFTNGSSLMHVSSEKDSQPKEVIPWSTEASDFGISGDEKSVVIDDTDPETNSAVYNIKIQK